MTPFEAYQFFHAVRMHFTSETYDFFKYRGKTRLKYGSFEKARGKYCYEKLSRKKNCQEIILSNIVYRDIKWVGDLTTDEAMECHKTWKSINHNLTYFVCREIEILDDKLLTYFKSRSGQHPQFLKDVLSGRSSIETLTVLDDCMGLSDIWSKKIQDPIVWPNIKQKAKKYSPFLQYDRNKVKKTLFEVTNHLKGDINIKQS